MVAIIGNGTLATAISEKISSTLYDRSDCDFLQPLSDEFVKKLTDYDMIINCVAVNQGSTADILHINYIQPITLIEKLIKSDYQGRLILIGSHGASWTSWPDIPYTRLVYNNSKKNLRDFVKSVVQSSVTKMKMTIIEPSKFKSSMSGFQGHEASQVADAVVNILTLDSVNLLHVEMY